MFLLDKLSYFLITRAKSVVAYLKKFTKPRYVIAFVIIYPHIYTNIESVISATQEALVNLADQFFSWIEASFWGIYNYVRDKLQGIWFADQIAYLVAGLAMALPFLAYVIFKYAFTPVATALLTISLNILGIVFYIFCRVVIPALKMAFGAYLFVKFMPASYKYVAKALDRLAQGRFSGFLGALFGAFAPFSMFFVGPLIVSTVVDPACSAAYAPLTIPPTYLIPYVAPTAYQFTLSPTTSWILASIYGQHALHQYPAASYITAYISWDIQRLVTYSFIMPSITFGMLTPTLSYIWPYTAFVVYPTGAYPPYYPSAYVSPMPTFSAIYPHLSYSLTPGYLPTYLPYAISVIYPYLSYSITTGLTTLTALIEDISYLISAYPTPLYGYVHIEDLSYIAQGYPTPHYVYAYIEDLSFLMGPLTISAGIVDYSYIVYPW